MQLPPAIPEPFEVLGIPQRYHLDINDLEQRYRELARAVHPDRQTKKSSTDRMYALQWTATLNAARRVLRDPIARAWQLATGSAVAPSRLTLDSAFLAEMFELREADEEAPGTLAREVARLRPAVEAEIDGMFTLWEAGQGTLEAVPQALARLKYLS